MNYFALAWGGIGGLLIIAFPDQYKQLWVEYGQPWFLQKRYAAWSLTTYRLMGVVCICLSIVVAVYAK